MPILTLTSYIYQRFNGAAAFQPRKVGLDVIYSAIRLRLQWCRGFSAAERRRHRPPTHQVYQLQWCRGFSAAERGHCGICGRFLKKLQWCRGFSAAESGVSCWNCDNRSGFNGAAAFQPRKVVGRRRLRGSPVHASMVPRLFSRGKPDVSLRCVHPREASMVPRLFSRGKCQAVLMAAQQGLLQWCRGFSAAEREHGTNRKAVALLLQWCRGFSAAESRRHIFPPEQHGRASMVPRLFSRGKTYPAR